VSLATANEPAMAAMARLMVVAASRLVTVLVSV